MSQEREREWDTDPILGERLERRSEHGWTVLMARRNGKPAPPRDLGHPALWKQWNGSGRRFELPPTFGNLDTDFENRCLSWASATYEGGLPTSWSPPDREEILEWLPPQGLVVRDGAFVEEIEVDTDADRLAFRCAIAQVDLANLPSHRRDWLEATVRDAHDRWRLARVGIDGGSRVVVEVDLSGAPTGLLEELVRVAVDTVRHVATWLHESVRFLVDSTQPCRLLELCRP